MAERRINREAWADLVSELIASEARGNRAAFARLIGVDYKSVGRWLKSEVDVSEESVRLVARKTERASAELLVRVGYYRPDEVTAVAAQEPDPDDEAMRIILETPVSPRMKVRMIRRLHELRERDRQRQLEEVKFWTEQARDDTSEGEAAEPAPDPEPAPDRG